MSRYSGPGGNAADVRKQKRADAEQRNTATPIERRAEFRRRRKQIRARVAELAEQNEASC